MNIKLQVTVESRFLVDRRAILSTITELAQQFKLRGAILVEVVIVGDRKMRLLSRVYRDIDDTPPMLAFALEDPHPACQRFRLVKDKEQLNDSLAKVTFVPSPDGSLWLGSIVISYPQARALAADRGKLVDAAIAALVKQGMRYLLGMSE